jgi:hypothetical protein
MIRLRDLEMAACTAPGPTGGRCARQGMLLDAARGGWVCAAHAKPGPLQRRALRHAIRQAMVEPRRYLAATLAEQTDERLGVLLGCAPTAVWRLRLASWPRPDRWDEDVQLMAEALWVQPARLASLLGRFARARGLPPAPPRPGERSPGMG